MGVRSIITTASVGLMMAVTGSSLAQEIGVNSAIRNTVSIQPDGGNEASAVVGGDVRLADTVRSGDDSFLQVMLLDETVFSVGANASMVIDRFVYDPDTGAGEVAASVARGAFRFMSGRTARRKGDSTIDTPVASMGIRGTIVDGAVGAEAIKSISGLESVYSETDLDPDAALFVLRGPGENQSGLNKDGAIEITNKTGSVTLVKANTAVLVPGENKPIIGPFLLPDLAVEAMRDVLGLGTVPAGNEPEVLPEVRIPVARDLDEEITDPLIDPEDAQILDGATEDCPIFTGVPTTDGGLILDGPAGNSGLVDDFGGFAGSVECF